MKLETERTLIDWRAYDADNMDEGMLMGHGKTEREAINDYVERLDEQFSLRLSKGVKNQWTPVSESMPPDGAEIMFWDADRKSRLHGTQERGEFWSFERGGYVNVAAVTHWMPLPEAPKP